MHQIQNYCLKIWRHPLNRKYITYREAIRGEPSHGREQHAQKWVKFSRVVSEIYERADKQTYSSLYFEPTNKPKLFLLRFSQSDWWLITAVDNLTTASLEGTHARPHWLRRLDADVQGAPIKNNPLGKIYYLSYCNRFFSPNLQFLQSFYKFAIHVVWILT